MLAEDSVDFDAFRRNKAAEVELAIEQDDRRRDQWMSEMKRFRASSAVLVGEGVSLHDVYRWLDRAVN